MSRYAAGMSVTLADVVSFLDGRYPPDTAEPWDAVGLVVGDPLASVRRVLFALDPVDEVVDEALGWGADLIVTHHPLFLRGVHSVAATTFKGALVHRLIRGGCGLYAAHTNADAARGGVAEALADLLGLRDCTPLVPVGDGVTGTGRVGRLGRPESLEAFAERVAAVVPRTVQGVRVAGELSAQVETVAVVGGSGDSLFDAVRTCGADVYVTSDLRHHPVSELRERAMLGAGPGGTPFLVDVAHYASEWPWLPVGARDLADAFGGTLAEPSGPDAPIAVRVSTLVTDPWTARIG